MVEGLVGSVCLVWIRVVRKGSRKINICLVFMFCLFCNIIITVLSVFCKIRKASCECWNNNCLQKNPFISLLPMFSLHLQGVSFRTNPVCCSSSWQTAQYFQADTQYSLFFSSWFMFQEDKRLLSASLWFLSDRSVFQLQLLALAQLVWNLNRRWMRILEGMNLFHF